MPLFPNRFADTAPFDAHEMTAGADHAPAWGRSRTLGANRRDCAATECDEDGDHRHTLPRNRASDSGSGFAGRLRGSSLRRANGPKRAEGGEMLWLILGVILLVIAIAGGVIIHPILFVLGIVALVIFIAGR